MRMPSIFFYPDVLVVLADYIAIHLGCLEEEEITNKDREFIADVLNTIIQEVTK